MEKQRTGSVQLIQLFIKHLQVCNLIWRNQHSHPVPDEHKVSLPFFVLACPEEDELNVQLAKDG